jgi:death-on-curing protein
VSGPVWVTLDQLHHIHERQVELFGGQTGVEDETELEDALAQVHDRFRRGRVTDPLELAATYLVSLAQQHGFLDGNKRVALAAMLVFLKRNGHSLQAAPRQELYALALAAANDEIDVPRVAAWLRTHLQEG